MFIHQCPPLMVQGSRKKRKQCLLDASGLTEVVAEQTVPLQAQARWGPSSKSEEQTWVPSRTKTLSASHIHLQNGTSFLQWRAIRYIKYISGRPHAQEQLDKTKQTQCYFCKLFVSICFVHFFLLLRKKKKVHKIEDWEIIGDIGETWSKYIPG